MFLGKGVLKICSRFTGAHPCQSVIEIELLCSFIEIALREGRSPVNLLQISRAPFPKNTYGGLLLGESPLGKFENEKIYVDIKVTILALM